MSMVVNADFNADKSKTATLEVAVIAESIAPIRQVVRVPLGL